MIYFVYESESQEPNTTNWATNFAYTAHISSFILSGYYIIADKSTTVSALVDDAK